MKTDGLQAPAPLLLCPSCRKKIASSATVCPKCGATLGPGWQWQARKIADDLTASDRRLKRVAGYLVLGLFAYAWFRSIFDG